MAERGLSSHRRKRRQRRIRRLIGFLILFLITFTLMTSYLLEVVRVTDDAMTPAVQPGDVLLSSPILHLLDRFRDVQRGDLVMVENPARPEQGMLNHVARRILHFLSLGRLNRGDQAGTPLLLRRVVGLPGERILMEEYVFYLRDGEGPWVSELELTDGRYELRRPEEGAEQIAWPGMDIPGAPDSRARTIPEESYYLASDHRGGPMDSRIWGPVPVVRLHGALFFRLFPLDRFGPIPVE
jgi:signal peptidase I